MTTLPNPSLHGRQAAEARVAARAATQGAGSGTSSSGTGGDLNGNVATALGTVVGGGAGRSSLSEYKKADILDNGGELPAFACPHTTFRILHSFSHIADESG